MEYQPEQYLKDGKLNPDMVDSDSLAFGFEYCSVDPPYSILSCNVYLINGALSPVFSLENTSVTICYIYLCAVFLQSMISNHQLMIRVMSSSSKLNSPVDYCCKHNHMKMIADCLLFLTLICIYRYPAPFKCTIKPQSPAAEALIQGSINEAF